MMDDGILTLYTLGDTSESGQMPNEALIPVKDDDETLSWGFKARTIGYNRQYIAQGVGARVDMLIRTWRNPAKIGMYAILTDYEDQENEEGDQYRIDNVQHLTDEDGLKVTDLTLYRLDQLYEIAHSEP